MADSNKFLNVSSNYNRLFNNELFIKQLVGNVKATLGRQLVETEKIYIINFLKNINPVIFSKKSPTAILQMLKESIINNIQSLNTGNDDDEEEINIHELLKTEIGLGTSDDVNAPAEDAIAKNFSNQVDVTSVLGSRTFGDLQKILNPAAIKKYAYIVLDTRYRILDNDGQTSVSWNFVNNATTGQGTVNAVGDIQNITAIKVFPIKMPYSINTDNDYSRVTLYIQEFSAQSFIAQENTRFHFIFESSIHDKYINLTARNNNNGVYNFRNPITRLDTITLLFGSPLQPILFDVDRINASVTTYGPVTVFTSTRLHNISTGDRIYMNGFNSDNPYVDAAIISAFNTTVGNIITVIDEYSFSLDIDTTQIFSIGVGTINVVNGSPIVIGTGTSFTTLFSANDDIEINGNIYFIVGIASDTSLTLTVNYADVSANNLPFNKNNQVFGLVVGIYLGSKRMFIPMEIEYLDNTILSIN